METFHKHMGRTGEGYLSHGFDIDLGGGDDLHIIQEWFTAEQCNGLSRVAIFFNCLRGRSFGGGMDIAIHYQPRDFISKRFEPRVQIMGVRYSPKEREQRREIRKLMACPDFQRKAVV